VLDELEPSCKPGELAAKKENPGEKKMDFYVIEARAVHAAWLCPS
jgi:hypothetical protein